MKRPYCCDESRDMYERYYDSQQKGRGDFPVYVGRHTQRGHGIGSILSSLFRRILPTLKMVAPHVLRTGANVMEDLSAGKKLKDSAIKRIPETLREVIIPNKPGVTAANFLEKQTGSGKRKRGKRDIFD